MNYGIAPQSYSELLEIIPEHDIYKFYLGHCTLNTHFKSVFRGERTASMCLFLKDNKILWKDFGKLNIENKGHRAVHLVMYLEGIGYQEALSKIWEDITQNNSYTKSSFDLHTNENVTKQIKFKYRLPSYILDFYAKGGITKETLTLFNVYYCTEFRFNEKLWHKSIEQDWMAIYMFSTTYNTWQVYRPFAEYPEINKRKRFRLNNSSDLIMGYAQLPKFSPTILINKSYKDVLTVYEVGFPSVCRPGELDIMEPYQIASLKQRCNELIFVGDNDETGKTVQKAYKEKYGIRSIQYPIEKDSFEFSENRGKKELKKILNKLIYDK